MASISLKGVQKAYGGAAPVIRDLDLEIGAHEFCVFLGPSGCGKSTLLRMIAGLEDVSDGEIAIGGRRVNDLSAAQRGVAMVFQSYALFPHMTVYENIAFGLRLAKTPKPEIDRKVREAARILQLEALLERHPKALSGGQRQRVAIGRAIVREPGVFLFDEPLSNLDATLRGQTRIEIGRLHRQFAEASVVYVTHDQVEAMTLADKIVLLHSGEDTERYGALLLTRRVTLVEALGEHSYVHLEQPDGTLIAKAPGELRVAPGDRVRLRAPAASCHLFAEDGFAIAAPAPAALSPA